MTRHWGGTAAAWRPDRRAAAPRAQIRSSPRRRARPPEACARSPAASFGRPSCSAARPEKYRARKSPGSRRERAIERGPGFSGDDAVRRAGQGLAEVGLAHGGRFQQPQRIAPRLHGVVVAAEPHIDRADDLPAAAVLGIAFEMRFHPRDQIGNGPLLRRQFAPRRLGLRRQVRRTERQIKSPRPDRQQQQRRERHDAPPPSAALLRSGHGNVGSRKQPPRHLDPRGLGLALADQPRGTVALDLLELVAIDRDIAAGAKRRAPRQRPKHRENRRRRHQGHHKPKHHGGGFTSRLPRAKYNSAEDACSARPGG